MMMTVVILGIIWICIGGLIGVIAVFARLAGQEYSKLLDAKSGAKHYARLNAEAHREFMSR